MQPDIDIIDDSRGALQSIRKALIELYASVGADPASPQDTARRFGINRNLTWKLSRVMSSPDPFAALNFLPGQQGIDLVIRAFQRAGAPPDGLAALTGAMERFNEVVTTHAGGRDQFELTLESTGVFERERSLESGRELAFRGNSMIWGVQIRTRLLCTFAGPSAGRCDAIDFVQVSGLFDFRRLRPQARWRLGRARVHDNTGESHPDIRPSPLVPDNGIPHAPFVIPEFCSSNMPAIEAVDGPEGTELVLPGGPVGNTAAFDCVLGMLVRGLPRFADEENPTHSGAAPINAPTERLLMDAILHRDLGDGPFTTNVYGFPHGGLDSPAAQNQQNLLPISAEVEELAGLPPTIATPMIPRYGQIAARVYERMNWNPKDFRGWRMSMAYPPMSSVVVLSWRLPKAPK